MIKMSLDEIELRVIEKNRKEFGNKIVVEHAEKMNGRLQREKLLVEKQKFKKFKPTNQRAAFASKKSALLPDSWWNQKVSRSATSSCLQKSFYHEPWFCSKQSNFFGINFELIPVFGRNRLSSSQRLQERSISADHNG